MGKAMKIRKDDNVKIIAGKDAGKTGRVLRTEPKRGVVFVEGLNIVKRHQRPTSVKETQKGTQVGGIVDKEAPIHISNVMLLDPSDNKPTRVQVKRGKDGKRKRIATRTGTEID
jgi:large subunit ribosomal protein L24